MIKDWINNSLRLVGLDLARFLLRDEVAPPDFRDDELAILNAARLWTMTSPPESTC